MLLLVACQDKAPAKPPAPPADTGPNALTVTFGADETKLAWGIATYRATGLEIRLAEHPLTCADVDKHDRPGMDLTLSVPPGPQGKFYTQSPIGVGVTVARGRELTPVPPDETTLALESFTPLVAGEHVKGKLVAATHVDGTNVMANGTFDVAVCKEPVTPVRALRAETPSTPATGTLDGAKLEPRTVHAIVKTREQRGPYVARVVFYDKADVPCPTEAQDNTTDVLFVVSEFATRKRPTPAVGNLVRRDPGAEIAFDVWIAFENAAFEKGEHIVGSLWGQPLFDWEGKGDFGGTFDALVCIP